MPARMRRAAWAVLWLLPCLLRAWEPEAKTITLVSLNVANTARSGELAEELKSRGLDGADIYLLQEVLGEDWDKSKMAGNLLPGPPRRVYYRAAFHLDAKRLCGLAILSRFPLSGEKVIALKRNNMNFRTRNRIALAATVDSPLGPLSVMNTHLDTRIDAEDRIEQLRPIVDYALGTGLPAIVAGDLNTNPHRWLFHLFPVPYAEPQGEKVRRYMSGMGFDSAVHGAAATHDVAGMQLDWVFAKGLRANGTRIRRLKNSDHHAIWTRLSAGSAAPGVPNPPR